MRSYIGAASVFVMATSLFACAETDSTETGGTTDQTVIVMTNGSGSGGSNGLSNDDFMAAQRLLAKSARLYGLVDPGTMNVSAGIKNLLIPEKGGLAVLKYAVACTVPRGMDIYADGETLKGLGHLTNGADWLDGPLSHTAINELMACMAIHVNAFGAEIPILLSGAAIRNDPIGHPEFSVSEARWVASVNSDDVPTYTVYPSKYVAQECADVLSAFKDRVCGQWSSGCNFVEGDPQQCTDDAEGNWTCDTTPAIESWLIPEYLDSMYPGCGR